MDMSDNTAQLDGYTTEVMVIVGPYDLHLFVKPETDFDASFKAYDADMCEYIRVNGWLIEDISYTNH
jgi:hypothetical protein